MTPAELRECVLELAEALARYVRDVKLALRCSLDELEAAFPEGARTSYVYDGDGEPAYVLESFRVVFTTAGATVELTPRYPEKRPATAREIRQLRAARPHPRSATLTGAAPRPLRLRSRPPGVPA